MYRGKYFEIDNFGGGMTTDIPATKLPINQGRDCDNFIVLPNGLGLRSRPGDVVFNSSAMNSGANVQGIGYYLQSGGNEWLASVCGDKIFKSDSLDGTMDDITGTVVVTGGQDNRWSLITFNDTLYGFGGPKGNPDAAWKWTGSGNAAVLSGNPSTPLEGAVTANNRVFGWSGSTMYWTIIGDAEDWSGSGSGSAVIGSLNDNEKITGAIVISTNYMLVFKENCTHQMVISQAPFSVYSLFETTGCVGKNANINIDGIVYYISQNLRMYSTNGQSLTEHPGFDTEWALVKSGEESFIQGNRIKGKDYDWLVWLVRYTGLNDNDGVAFIWDLKNSCWIHCTSGFSHNVAGVDNNGNVYYGSYDGKIYKPMQEGNYDDDSESGAAITAQWRSGHLNPDVISKIVRVHKIEVVGANKASGTVTIKYGHDGLQEEQSFTIDQTQPLTSGLYYHRGNTCVGRGNTFNYTIYNSSSTIDIEVHKLILAGKVSGQKEQEEQ